MCSSKRTSDNQRVGRIEILPRRVHTHHLEEDPSLDPIIQPFRHL